MKNLTLIVLVSLGVLLNVLSSMAGSQYPTADQNGIIWDHADANNNWSGCGINDATGDPEIAAPPFGITWSAGDPSSILFMATSNEGNGSELDWSRINHPNPNWMWNNLDKIYSSVLSLPNLIYGSVPDRFSLTCGNSIYNTVLAYQNPASGADNPIIYLYNGQWNENDSTLCDNSVGTDIKTLVTSDGKYVLLAYTGGTEYSRLYSQFGAISGNSINWNPQFFCSQNTVYDIDFAVTDNLGNGYGLLYFFRDCNDNWGYSTGYLKINPDNTTTIITPNVVNAQAFTTDSFCKMAMTHNGSTAAFIYCNRNKPGNLYYQLISLQWNSNSDGGGTATTQNTSVINGVFDSNTTPYFDYDANDNCNFPNCYCSGIHITDDGNHLAMLYIGADKNMYLLTAYIHAASLNNITIRKLMFDFNNQTPGLDAKFYDIPSSSASNTTSTTKIALMISQTDNNVNNTLECNTGTITWSDIQDSQITQISQVPPPPPLEYIPRTL